jgi:hypothetical protein
MGKYNSSEWRVRRIFDALYRRDPTGSSWLPQLLALPERNGRQRLSLKSEELGRIEIAAWSSPKRVGGLGFSEAGIPAPDALLRWLVEYVEQPKSKNAWKTSESTQAKRRELIARNLEVQRDALARLSDSSLQDSRWEILEGPSYPDVFLQTPTVILVIEGKFTEARPTTSTTWLSGRHQMLRHIDAAWDQRAGRRVFGCFIVEDVNAIGWRRASDATVSAEALRSSLPHRTEAERRAIADAFLGITSWKALSDATGLPSELLIDPRAAAR